MDQNTKFRSIWIKAYLALGLWLGFLISFALIRTKLFLLESTYEFEFFSNSFFYTLWGVLGAILVIWLSYTWYVFLNENHTRKPLSFYFLLAPFISLYLISPTIYTFTEDQKRKYIFPEADSDFLKEQMFLAMPFLMVENSSYQYKRRTYPEKYSKLNLKKGEDGLLLNMDGLPDFHYIHIKNYSYPNCQETDLGYAICRAQPEKYLARIHNWIDQHPDSIRITLEGLKVSLDRWNLSNNFDPNYVWNYLLSNDFKPRHTLTTHNPDYNRWAERNDFELWKDLDSTYLYSRSHFDDEILKQYIPFKQMNWMFNIHDDVHISWWLEAELIFTFLFIAFILILISVHVYNQESPKTYFAGPMVLGFFVALGVLFYLISAWGGVYFSDVTYLNLFTFAILAVVISKWYRKNENWNFFSDSFFFFLSPFVPMLLYFFIENSYSKNGWGENLSFFVLLSPYFVFPIMLWLNEKQKTTLEN